MPSHAISPVAETLHCYQPKVLSESLFMRLYADIKQFRECFNLPCEDLLEVDEKQHAKLLTEELLELITATTITDKVDGAVDSIYVMFGHIVNAGLNYHSLLFNNHVVINVMDTIIQTGEVLGFDFLKAWDIVHASNLSKLCTDDDVHETQAFYDSKKIPTTITAVGTDPNNNALSLYAVKVAEDCLTSEGTALPAGKVLKSINYTPADFSNL